MLRTLFVFVSASLLVPSLVPAHAQQTSALRLEDFVNRTVETNKNLAAARTRISEARGLLRQAGVRPAPSLDISGTSARPFGSRGEEEYSASFLYEIETAGKRGKRLEIAEKGILLAQAEAADQIRQLTFRVASKYIEALADQRALDTLDRLIAIHGELLRLLDARIREGDAAPLERQLVSVELGQSQAQRAIATGKFETALRELRSLAGLTGTTSMSLVEPPPIQMALTLDDLQQRALRQRSDLSTSRLTVDQAEAKVALAEAQRVPDLALSSSYSREYGGFDDLNGLDASGRPVQLKDRDDKLSIAIEIPLGTRRRNGGNVEAARARAMGASLRREYDETVVLLEVENAWQMVQSSQQAVNLFEQGLINQSEQNVETIRQAYQLGQLRLIDVLNEQRRAIEVRLAYIRTNADLQRAIADLEFAVGGNLR